MTPKYHSPDIFNIILKNVRRISDTSYLAENWKSLLQRLLSLNHAIQYELFIRIYKNSWYNQEIYCDIWLFYLKFWLKTILNLVLDFYTIIRITFLGVFLFFVELMRLSYKPTQPMLNYRYWEEMEAPLTEALLSGSDKRQKQLFADILQTRCF